MSEDGITSAQATVQEESGSDCSHGVATPLAAGNSGFHDNMMSGIRRSRDLKAAGNRQETRCKACLANVDVASDMGTESDQAPANSLIARPHTQLRSAELAAGMKGRLPAAVSRTTTECFSSTILPPPRAPPLT